MPVVADRRRSYPSDLTDAQWETIKKFVPSARRGGRRRTTNVRMVIDGILYLINSGCAWRYLPREFPPWKTIYHYFQAWIVNGVWKTIHEELRNLVRRSCGKSDLATYLIIDSQSVRAPTGSNRGFDGYKRVKGRKRQILVDTLGLIHGVYVHSADLSDTKEGVKILDKISSAQANNLKFMHADMGYRGTFEDTFYFMFKFLPHITRRENTGQGKRKSALEKKVWSRKRPKIKEPKRWVVERTIAWFNNYRRLSRDYEKNLTSAETVIYFSMIQLMLRRLHPSESL